MNDCARGGVIGERTLFAAPEFKMARSKLRIFTPGAVEIIRELAGQGKSASEIADKIGSTAASVRVKCCQLKIQLARGRRSLPRGRPRQFAEQNLVVCMRPAAYAAFKRKAAHMQKSADELARMLLEAIVSSNIYEAVLDDRE